MEAVRSSRRLMLVVLLAIAVALAGLAAYAAFPTGAKGQEPKPPAGPLHEVEKPLRPRIAVQSGVVELGQCFVTTQKELEGPIPGKEEIRRHNEKTSEFIGTGEFREVLREMEIIKVISACAAQEEDRVHNQTTSEGVPTGRLITVVRPHVSVILVQCTKDADLRGGGCQVLPQRPGPGPGQVAAQ